MPTTLNNIVKFLSEVNEIISKEGAYIDMSDLEDIALSYSDSPMGFICRINDAITHWEKIHYGVDHKYLYASPAAFVAALSAEYNTVESGYEESDPETKLFIDSTFITSVRERWLEGVATNVDDMEEIAISFPFVGELWLSIFAKKFQIPVGEIYSGPSTQIISDSTVSEFLLTMSSNTYTVPMDVLMGTAQA